MQEKKIMARKQNLASEKTKTKGLSLYQENIFLASGNISGEHLILRLPDSQPV